MADLTQRSFSAVIFDVDGTLADSRESLRQVWTTWLREHGIAPDPSVNLHGMTNRAIVEMCLPQAEGAELDEAIDRVEALDLELAGLTTAMPGAQDALTSLDGAPVALATSALDTVARARLDSAGMILPAVVVTGDQVTRSKPDPEIFLLAAAELGVDPSDALVVEDAPAGVAAARAGGFSCLALTTTSDPAQLPADLVVPDLSHVLWSVGDTGITVEVHRPTC